MVIEQRQNTNEHSTPPPHTMDGSNSQNNQSVCLEVDDTILRTLLERMSSNTYAVPITSIPSSSSDPLPFCEFCTTF